jgi:hypothetical protein
MGLGSEIRKKPIPDRGVKKAPDPGSGSATLVCTEAAFKHRKIHILRKDDISFSRTYAAELKHLALALSVLIRYTRTSRKNIS